MIGVVLMGLVAAQLDFLPEQIHRGWTIEERREEKPHRTGTEDHELYDPLRRVLFVYAATVARSREEAELERTRAVITTAVYAFDVEAKWSERPAWRAANSWRGNFETVMAPLEHAANIDPRGFVDARGRRSPRWDLATFAARYFTGDRATKCRLLAQSRFLTDRLLATGANAAHPTCKNFERWARVEQIEHMEIDLASPTANTIGSLFGHLFMQIVGTENRVIAFLAESRGVLEDDPLYPVKGIFGGYEAALFEKPFLDVHRDYVVNEGRHIRRWKLKLTPNEQLRLLELIWTRMHTARYDYYFFAQNCATLLLELFNAVADKDRRLVAEGSLGKGPASVLDALSLAHLIEYFAEPFSSYRGEAAAAEKTRAPISRKIVELEPELAKSIAVIERAEDPRQRAPAYDRVAGFLATELDPEQANIWIRASAEIEAHASAEANLLEETELAKKRRAGAKALVKAYRESLPIEIGPIVEPILELIEHGDEATRFAGYRAASVLITTLPEHTGNSLRLYVLARADLWFDTIRKNDPELHAALFLPDPSLPVMEQNFVKGFERFVERAFVTKISPSVLAVQRAKRALFARENVARRRSDTERAQQIAHEQARYEHSYRHTGVDALSFAGGYYAGDFGFVLRGAAYEETLGEQRRHGFPSTTAFTFLKSESFWTKGELWRPIVLRSETQLIGYRSIGEARRFGFELHADLSTRRVDQRSDLSPSATFGGLWSLLSSDDFADHLIASGGIAYQASFPSDQSGDARAMIAPVAIEARKALGGPLDALRGSFAARPSFDLARRHFALAYRADAELRWLLAERADLWIARDVGVSLIARARWERVSADELGFDLGVTFD